MKFVSVLAVAALLASQAYAQAPAPAHQPDPVKFEVSRANLALIGTGIMKLPYEQAAPLLNDLQRQLEAQTPKIEPPKNESKPAKK